MVTALERGLVLAKPMGMREFEDDPHEAKTAIDLKPDERWRQAEAVAAAEVDRQPLRSRLARGTSTNGIDRKISDFEETVDYAADGPHAAYIDNQSLADQDDGADTEIFEALGDGDIEVEIDESLVLESIDEGLQAFASSRATASTVDVAPRGADVPHRGVDIANRGVDLAHGNVDIVPRSQALQRRPGRTRSSGFVSALRAWFSGLRDRAKTTRLGRALIHGSCAECKGRLSLWSRRVQVHVRDDGELAKHAWQRDWQFLTNPGPSNRVVDMCVRMCKRCGHTNSLDLAVKQLGRSRLVVREQPIRQEDVFVLLAATNRPL